MVDSGVGRTKGAELGDRRAQARPLTEANDGDVRKPWPPLAAVDPQSLEALVQVFDERAGPVAVLLEDEHADTPRFAIAGHAEHGPLDTDSSSTERLGDGRELPGRARAEEGQCDVEVSAWDDSTA